MKIRCTYLGGTPHRSRPLVWSKSLVAHCPGRWTYGDDDSSSVEHLDLPPEKALAVMFELKRSIDERHGPGMYVLELFE